MASRYFQQFFFSLNHMPVWLEGSVTIGAAGAVSSYTGDGTKTVVKLATGVYQVNLQDPYYRFLAMSASSSGSTPGAAVAGGAFVPTTLYQIVSLGNTTQAQWEAAGLTAGVPAAVGVPFVATAIGAGTGTVKAIVTSGVAYAEVAPNVQQTVSQKTKPYFILQTFDIAGAAVSPASGSVLRYSVTLRNSSVKGKGE